MKKLQLILTNPCSENWDEMQTSKVGRFCESCEKNIIDLTNKSDTQLFDFFRKKPTNVCGRLLSTQLNRDLIVPPSKLIGIGCFHLPLVLIYFFLPNLWALIR